MKNNPLERACAMKILVELSTGVKRFSELVMDAKIQSSILNRRLKELQETGLIERREDEKTKEVRYTLTIDGRRLFPHLKRVYDALGTLKLETK